MTTGGRVAGAVLGGLGVAGFGVAVFLIAWYGLEGSANVEDEDAFGAEVLDFAITFESEPNVEYPCSKIYQP